MPPSRETAAGKPRDPRVISVAIDPASASVIAAYIEQADVQLLAAYVGLGKAYQGLDIFADLMIIEARSGWALQAYNIGRAVIQHGMAVLFVTPGPVSLAIRAIASGVPRACLLEIPCGKAAFRAEIGNALVRRTAPDTGADQDLFKGKPGRPRKHPNRS